MTTKRNRRGPEAAKERQAAAERVCFWKEFGIRCTRPGAFSPNLHGRGPHFCSEHYERMLGRRPAASEEPISVDGRVNDIVPRHEGESMHDWSMRCREQLLTKVGLRTMREPGQEG